MALVLYFGVSSIESISPCFMGQVFFTIKDLGFHFHISAYLIGLIINGVGRNVR